MRLTELRVPPRSLAPYRVVTAFASALGWLRFMFDTSALSNQIGPLVMMTIEIVKDNVAPFLVMCAHRPSPSSTRLPRPPPRGTFVHPRAPSACPIRVPHQRAQRMHGSSSAMPISRGGVCTLPPPRSYACFFMMMTTLVFGILRAMGAEPGMWETVKVLFDLTINPSIERFGELEVRANGEEIDGGLSHMVKVFFTVWIMLANIVLLNVIIAMMNSTYGNVRRPSRPS